jgi:O-antigen ligase
MFILPGLIALVVFIYARPFEFIPELQSVPFLYIFFVLALLGFVIDFRLGLTRIFAVPQFRWVIGFVIWAAFTAAVRGALATGTVLQVAVDLALFLLIAHGVRTFKGIEALTTAVLACSLFVSVVVVHQGLQDKECITVRASDVGNAVGEADGRKCDEIAQCYLDAPEPDAIYRCEHAGMLGTTSISGRVRYIGVLLDPNETALVVAIGLPLALGFYQRQPNRKRMLLVAVVGLLAAVTVVMSKSRGGLLVMGAVLGVYFVRRYGWRGAVLAVIMSAPLYLLGGREGDEADSSSEERLEAWYEGILMFRQYPIIGVGLGQFTEHHYRTAHNSFVLAPAELGFIGMMAWTTVLYVCVKIPLTALDVLKGKESEVAQIWAMSLLASFAGLLTGAFFLSFSYHFVLWIYVGLAGAYFSAVHYHRPDFKIRFGVKDLVLIAGGNIAILGLIYVYAIYKL